ncbi:MAG: hypothetical protein H6895_08325 [Defluviimonas sp.]|nr:hypothetical protein [Paracoccaceae bacterium]MCC0064078.1 hypothetical protein [Defluviimonas sp.]
MTKKGEAQTEIELGAEIEALRAEIEALAGTLKRIGRAGVEEARAAAVAELGEGAASVEAFGAGIAREARARPWRSLGLAALAGLALGFVLRR